MIYVIWIIRIDLVINYWILNYFIVLFFIDIENVGEIYNLEILVLSVIREQIGSVIKLGVVVDNVICMVGLIKVILVFVICILLFKVVLKI